MNLKFLFQDFNASKFIVYTCLLVFVILLGLRLDEVIKWNYGAVFIPLWLWELLVFVGAIVGVVVWWRQIEYRNDDLSNIDFKAMIITVVLTLMVFIFQILLCINIEGPHVRMLWLVVFMPLFLVCPMSVAACIWAFRHDRSLELEAFFSLNVLQFIFIALKLDNIVAWDWSTVLVPLWILMCLLCIIVIYYIIWSILFLRVAEVQPEQRRLHFKRAIIALFLVLPLLIFEVLLARRLDGSNTYSFSAVLAPLLVTLVALIGTSFGQKGGNQWWFGIRKDFCPYLLGVCPCLQEYGNISYKIHPEFTDDDQSERSSMTGSRGISSMASTPVVPVVSIELPD